MISPKIKNELLAVVQLRYGGGGKKGDTTPSAAGVLLGKGTKPGGDSRRAEVICTES